MITHNGSNATCNRCGKTFSLGDVIMQTKKYPVTGHSIIILPPWPNGINIPAMVNSTIPYSDIEIYHYACFAGPSPISKQPPLDSLKAMLRDMDPRESQAVYEFMHDALGCRMRW